MKDTHIGWCIWRPRVKICCSLFIFVFLICDVSAFAAEEPRALRDPSRLEAETFARLKKKFPGDILSGDLKQLHELAESAEYKNFLEAVYPGASVPLAFAKVVNGDVPLVDDRLYTILPSKKRYLTYYREYFKVGSLDEVTDAEHFIIHHKVTVSWVLSAIDLGGDKPAYRRTEGLRLSGRGPARLVRTPQFKAMMKRRFGIEIEGKPNLHNSTQMFPVYMLPIQSMARVCLAADARWLASMFEKHGGRSDAIIWVALQDPALLSRLRYAFTKAETLLHFVERALETAEPSD